jgi:hypothetical protein
LATSPVTKLRGGHPSSASQAVSGRTRSRSLAERRVPKSRLLIVTHWSASVSSRQSFAAQGEHEINQRAFDAEELSLQAAGLGEQLAKTRDQTAKAALHLDSWKAELDNDRAKLQNLETDPYHFWASKNTGTKILAAIGMLGGGLLAGLKGGENQFLKFVQQTMAEDKADRLAKIRARQMGVKVKQDDWDKARAKLDEDLADIETDGRQLATVSAQIRSYARTLGTHNAALAAKLNAQADAFDAQALEKYAEVDAKGGDRIVENIRNEPDRFVGGAAAVKESDIQGLADDLTKEGLGESAARIQGLHDLMAQLPEGELPTKASRNIFSRGFRGAADLVGGEGTGAEILDTPAERSAAARFERDLNALKSKYLGAARSDAELADMSQGFAQVRTKEGLAQYILELERELGSRAATVKGGFRPEVAEEYERRRRSHAPRARPKSSRAE